ncbi:DsbA family protein [Nocardioides sp. L-11A]|uniref:DsbA family protein n=1 Tax=Nocardioides sp. L-11A TaxID=3043848 RepID=UPI00249C5CD2|nr:DsbA family protein [Nocardioides sp. L-11A]
MPPLDRPDLTRPSGGRRRGVLLVVALAVVGVLGVALLVSGLRDDGGGGDGGDGGDRAAGSERDAQSEDGASTEPAARDDDPGLARRLPGDPMAVGDPRAPVAIVEYADFRCPFCAKYARETLPRLVEKYVDAGLVRYEFRDLPMFGEDSENAALAGRAAGSQGRFWEFFDALYGAAPDSGHPPLPRQRLLELAEEAGVPDLGRFEREMDDPATRRAVEADLAEARELGLTSVPFFVIDDVALSGAQPWEVFEQVIDEQLQERGLPEGD